MTLSTKMASEKKVTSAYIFLAIGILAVSMAAIFVRLAQQEGVPSLLIAAGRLGIATLILTPLTLRSADYRAQIYQLSRLDRVLVVVSGFFLALHFATWVTSLEYTSVLISVVLVTTSPIWVALLEVFVLRARMTRLVVIGLVVALMGGLIIGSTGANAQVDSDNTLLGGALSLIGAITVAVYLIIGRRLRPHLSLAPYIWMVYGSAALILTAAILFTGTQITGYSTAAYLLLLAVALFPQLIGHTSFNYALAYLPATVVSVTTQAEPIGSAIIAIIVFSEIPGIGQILGSAVLLFGVLLASLGQKQSPSEIIETVEA